MRTSWPVWAPPLDRSSLARRRLRPTSPTPHQSTKDACRHSVDCSDAAPQLGVSVTSSAGPDEGELWVQLPNYLRAGGLAPDFFPMFTSATAQWAASRAFTSVWVLRMNSVIGDDPMVGGDFLRDAFFPRLREWGIRLAINVNGATLVDCGDRGSRAGDEAEQLQRLVDLGARITYLSLQSPLSKVAEPTCQYYRRETDFDRRIAGVVDYISDMSERFPGIKVGVVDAMPSKGWAYRDVYRRLVDAVDAAGHQLAFIHLDFPMESATPGWTNVREAEEFVRGELGVRFGLLYVSKVGGEQSNVAFRDNVLSAYRAYRAAGGRPDDLELTSWYRFPDANLPEGDEINAPFMNLVLEFCRLGGVVPRPALATPITSAFAGAA